MSLSFLLRATLFTAAVALLQGAAGPAAVAENPPPAAPAAPQTAPMSPAASRPSEEAGKAHLFIYLIDGFRALDIPAYGFPEMTTPALRDMMESGVTFTRHYAASPWSATSLASAFTSLYPCAHGLHKAGEKLPASATTLAEVLREAGYDTALFTSHPLLGPLSGLSQGFEHVEEIPGPFYPTPAKGPAQTSATLNRRILAWLEKRRSSAPVFAVIVSSDLMEPFGTPPPEGTRYSDATEVAWYGAVRKQLMARRPGPLASATGADLARLKVDPARFARAAQRLYDGAIFYNDHQVRTLRSELDARGFLKRSFFLVTSTRGEEFGEHDLFGHGATLYDSSVLIPFVLTRPGAPSPDQVGKATDNVDLMPTLLGLLRVPAPGGLQGTDRMLRPDLEIRRVRERFAFAQASPAGPAATGEMHMIVEGTIKMIEYEEAPSGIDRPAVELFRRETGEIDWERKSLAGGRPDLMADKREKLDAWKNQCESARLTADAQPVKPDPKLKEVLRALGYIQGPAR